jgi:tetratricopeptide (TPR) repeat protein
MTGPTAIWRLTLAVLIGLGIVYTGGLTLAQDAPDALPLTVHVHQTIPENMQGLDTEQEPFLRSTLIDTLTARTADLDNVIIQRGEAPQPENEQTDLNLHIYPLYTGGEMYSFIDFEVQDWPEHRLFSANASDNSLRLPQDKAPFFMEESTAIGHAIRGMVYHSRGQCEQAVEEFDALVDIPLGDSVTVDMLPGSIHTLHIACLYATKQYEAVIAAYDEARSDMLLIDHDIVAGAYAADSYARLFQYDAALAIDDELLACLLSLHENHPFHAYQIGYLADLYLLRGQHRLYLYEWDTVLEDYNTALELVPDLPRAYYLRGLLYYTQNSRQAAYADLTTFLALEANTPTAHPDLITHAEAYVAELTDLLATPPAG